MLLHMAESLNYIWGMSRCVFRSYYNYHAPWVPHKHVGVGLFNQRTMI